MVIKKGRMLIIDDKDAETMQRSFQKLDWEVDTAEDGEEGIQKITAAYEKGNPYRVVLLDYLLPGRNGFLIMEEIAKRWPDQCVVFLTGVARSFEDGIRGMQAGASGYLQKPLNPEKGELEILEAIRINRDRYTSRTLAKGIVHQVGGRAFTAASHIQRAMDKIRPSQSPEVYDELEQALKDVLAIDHFTYRLRTDVEGLKRGEGTFTLDKALEGAIQRASDGFAYRRGRMPRVERELELGIELSGEAIWFEEACAVIIDNALEAIDRQKQAGWVRIRTRSDANLVLISVMDNGVGIPESEQERIFEPGYTSRPGRGTGQGLPFAKYVIEQLYDGEIFFISKESEGTEFIISLPRH